MIDLDRIIDDAARTITAHEPPAYLRARVLARLDAPVARRGSWWWVPIAAAAVIVAGVMIVRRSQAPAAATGDRPVVASTGISAPANQRPIVNPSIAASVPVGGSTRVAHQEPVVSDDEAQWRARAVPALAPIAGVEFSEIQPAPLSIPQLDVQAIGTAAITVAPIDRISGAR